VQGYTVAREQGTETETKCPIIIGYITGVYTLAPFWGGFLVSRSSCGWNLLLVETFLIRRASISFLKAASLVLRVIPQLSASDLLIGLGGTFSPCL